MRTAQPSHLEMPQLTALQSTDDDDDDDGYISVREVWLFYKKGPIRPLADLKEVLEYRTQSKRIPLWINFL